ncbi:signal recognition particle, SRP9/SRP14 subunit [Metschnikowia bicuspidata var. bicuspidata NRRL YB-4993]|uniref:Signal recognition particle, SRP9/SRP14 subunit n=1 Tax=Metschnikowia bicuspidata var. bicuspidata NRRL YB-4993 TaxID=869754 RepID=A0A1A0HHL1_9ASCO|nr:signal recognition particle, SRP9/SRP14 subunit [Metschnikowia bicuspidata var. bicuspidata NRRL YB-4993]OBA23367.1 signal recognition particle, SRP9/SRP14 subunit [Metschnikowia bicuspidata var. bicuspidata NRRL YB-4993]
MLDHIARNFPLPSLSNAEFLKELASYLKAGEGSSSVHLTHKRLLPQSPATADQLSSNVISHLTSFETNTNTYYVLIRAKCEEKTLTTAVAPEELGDFWTKYSQIVKSGFKLKNKTK